MKHGIFGRALALLMTCQALVLARPADACTAFRMPVSNHVLVGRNFDWDYGHGLIIVNKRGVAKSVLPLHASDSLKWVSKYGSLTFNQAGRELPYGGLNEKGLMIEVLWLGWTSWPVTQAPSVNEVQWIQYQLDERSSVQDLVAHIDDARILSVFAKVHFFVCDAAGECATIEGLGDHVEIHTGTNLPLAALTNDTYASSAKYADSFLKNGTCASVQPSSMRSLDRFTRAACRVSSLPSEALDAQVASANSILDSVAQATYTKWQIVYDLTEKTISIRTQEAPDAKLVSLSKFDLSCARPPQVLDLNYKLSPGVSNDVSAVFTDYTQAANRSIVEKSLLNGFAHLPPATVDQIVAFPDTMACQAP